MRDSFKGQVPIQLGTPTDWFNWAKRHSGILLLGALAMAILAFRKSRPANELPPDTTGEEVPLFI